MRSRIAITALLVMGFALSSTGVGLAISGVSGSGSAGIAQYPSTTTTPTPPPTNETPPPPQRETPTPPPTNDTTPPADTKDEGGGGGVLGTQDEGSNPPPSAPAPAPVQATEQISTTSDSNQLPFTGFAVIPVLLAGVALMLAGLFLRRRSSHSPDA